MEHLPMEVAVLDSKEWSSYTAESGTSESAHFSPETPRDLDHEKGAMRIIRFYDHLKN
jgi:hypothetical protein